MNTQHEIVIEVKGRHVTLYADTQHAAAVAASLAVKAGAARVTVDGRIVGGPLGELLETENPGP